MMMRFVLAGWRTLVAVAYALTVAAVAVLALGLLGAVFTSPDPAPATHQPHTYQPLYPMTPQTRECLKHAPHDVCFGDPAVVRPDVEQQDPGGFEDEPGFP